MCNSCLYFHMRTDKEPWPWDRRTNRREMTDASSLWPTCGSVGKHGGIVAWYEALDQASGCSPVHLLLHEKTTLNSKGFGAHFRNTNAEFISSFFPLFWKLFALTDLTGWVVKRHVKHVSLLPGAVGTQDVIRVLHGVHQNHHLMMNRHTDGTEVKLDNWSQSDHCLD